MFLAVAVSRFHLTHTWKLFVIPVTSTVYNHAGPVGPWDLAGRPLGMALWEAEPEGSLLSDPLFDVTSCRGSRPRRGGLLLPGGICGGQRPAGLCGPWKPNT